jgi:hypothetical protein
MRLANSLKPKAKIRSESWLYSSMAKLSERQLKISQLSGGGFVIPRIDFVLANQFPKGSAVFLSSLG